MSLAAREEQIFVDGEPVNAKTLASWKNGKTGIAADLAGFLEEWFSPVPEIKLQTSGSTGTPKIIAADKNAVRESAKISCGIFKLKFRGNALLCLPTRYIAGKMMIVRALLAGMNLKLVEPTSTPFENLEETLDFAPITAMQAAKTLDSDNGTQKLARAGTILIGGGFIPSSLEEKLQNVPAKIFASYGMTETLSHIALRRVNGPERSDFFTPVAGIEISLSREQTLQISAPRLGIKHLVTNDLAEIRGDGRFKILGRTDSVINSGGIKIQAEALETFLHDACGVTLLAVPAPHEILGECVAVLWEGVPADEPRLLAAFERLPKHHRPKFAVRLDRLPRTPTGKLSRTAAKAFFQTRK